jgi:glyoxylase-like metal-dependent hydrolase (beta-lactamase superfamily II)
MANTLSYPFERLEIGKTQEVAPGIHWIRMPLPFSLNHINLWLVDDGDGWCAVDTGYNTDEVRGIWQSVFDTLLGGRPIRRVIVTHFHPDHLALAGWMCGKWNVALWMTYGEWLQGHLNRANGVTADLDMRIAFYRANGLGDEGATGYLEGRPDFNKIITEMPHTIRRINDGDSFAIGNHSWRVITGAGHSPEHAALYCEDLNVLISGDQVLPRITTNISLSHNEPDGNPLKLFIDSFDKFAELPEDVLVLPSHDRPFHGLHPRLDGLRDHHKDRLEVAFEACAEPATAVEMIPSLFSRKLEAHQLGFAIGEALSHANYLMHEGRLARETGTDGIIRFRQA